MTDLDPARTKHLLQFLFPVKMKVVLSSIRAFKVLDRGATLLRRVFAHKAQWLIFLSPSDTNNSESMHRVAADVFMKLRLKSNGELRSPSRGD